MTLENTIVSEPVKVENKPPTKRPSVRSVDTLRKQMLSALGDTETIITEENMLFPPIHKNPTSLSSITQLTADPWDF
ncbi:hypothetical protein A2863_03860 [Candidatus Woesebacteria bacterium RIFCSPHIGHO2_01_FULL_38_9b]|uniref:Uncharacterized protein n=1 Tax=Candidatus Woesebacteria bacterium RIFCSPHIGHO2_01_FULL_38_9b TaxID=1802493 RepID=A0A1F7Y536_9BACT|nr:MAG: hypothetical protein A2863_03860 [Candidatus Woesebacteria bacterium RIFCSPHIGHO2_01_FULL_38_9b]